jgi:hypothetical protein
VRIDPKKLRPKIRGVSFVELVLVLHEVVEEVSIEFKTFTVTYKETSVTLNVEATVSPVTAFNDSIQHTISLLGAYLISIVGPFTINHSEEWFRLVAVIEGSSSTSNTPRNELVAFWVISTPTATKNECLGISLAGLVWGKETTTVATFEGTHNFWVVSEDVILVTPRTKLASALTVLDVFGEQGNNLIGYTTTRTHNNESVIVGVYLN